MDSPGSNRPATERLRALQRLRDDGLVTDEEYEAQRARILDESFGPSETSTAVGLREEHPAPEASIEPSRADDSPVSSGAPQSPAPPPATDAAPATTRADHSGTDTLSQHAPEASERSRLHPASFPDWLRIVLVAGSALWLVTIPFLFSRGARYTWLPYVGAVTVPLFTLALIAGSLQDTTLKDACKDAEAVMRQEVAGRDLDWQGDCNSEGLDGYRVTEIDGGHAVAGSVHWTDAAGARKRTSFEVHVTGERAGVVSSSDGTIRAAPTPTPTPTRAPEPTPQRTPRQTPEATGIGDIVEIGSLNLTVLDVERHDGGLYVDANLRLRIEAVNARGGADEEYHLNAYFFKLVDSNGIAHEPYAYLCGSACPDQIGDAYLVRGGRLRGYVYFQLPAGRQLAELIYEPLFSLNKARISLAPVATQATSPTATSSPADSARPLPTRAAGTPEAMSGRVPTPVPSECSAEAAAKRVSASVALVRTTTGLGTAFYTGNSEWLTAGHVVAGETSVRLTNHVIDITATVTDVHGEFDLAVLTANTSVAAVTWGDTPPNGAGALALGYGRGQRSLTAGVTRGIVSEQFTDGEQTYIRTDAPANAGNSGGPLLNVCGDVIGIVQAKLVGTAIEGVTYALSADSIRALLR